MIINTRNLLGHTTGVQRYTQSIIDIFDEKGIIYSTVKPENRSVSGLKGHLWEQVNLPLQIYNKSKSEVLWSPSNVGPVSISNQVVTIHDTVPFDHPEWLNKNFVSCYKFLQPIIAKKVKHIITISEFSKEKIIEHLNVPEDKITVIYNGVDIKSGNVDEPIKPFFRNLGDYILSVGSLEPRKNIPRLLKAFDMYKNESKSDIKLVIVGHRGVDRVFKTEQIENVSNNDIIYTGHVTDSELSFLYSNASGFCYPSMYEGFGLPPVEAMLYGIPVLTSATTALKELCLDRAILVNPISVESIAEGLFSLVHDKIDLNKIEQNRKYAESLSWSSCALKTYDVLSSV